MRQGKRKTQSTMVMFHLSAATDGSAKIGFIVPKKSVRLATRRNLVKRRLRASIRPLLSRFSPGSLTVFLARNQADKVSYAQINRELRHLVDGIENHVEQGSEKR